MVLAGPVAQALAEVQIGEYHMQAGGGRGPCRLMEETELRYWMYQMCMQTLVAASASMREACDSWNVRTQPSQSQDYAVRCWKHPLVSSFLFLFFCNIVTTKTLSQSTWCEGRQRAIEMMGWQCSFIVCKVHWCACVCERLCAV
jgi:hypothetical protein